MAGSSNQVVKNEEEDSSLADEDANLMVKMKFLPYKGSIDVAFRILSPSHEKSKFVGIEYVCKAKVEGIGRATSPPDIEPAA
uniref:Uncharacterized protein n=1 Tax=Solanum demissum TaxID=50514 RepID=Q6L3I0_SOLDE|nr:hypothetical protein SDM1_23t00011 [Solanum demissum]AAT40558.1 hypothetical protein SDM1_4t00008 [Solanum demissum]